MYNNMDGTMMPLNLINFKESFREDYNSINNSDFNIERYKLKWCFSNLKYWKFRFQLTKISFRINLDFNFKASNSLPISDFKFQTHKFYQIRVSNFHSQVSNSQLRTLKFQTSNFICLPRYTPLANWSFFILRAPAKNQFKLILL